MLFLQWRSGLQQQTDVQVFKAHSDSSHEPGIASIRACAWVMCYPEVGVNCRYQGKPLVDEVPEVCRLSGHFNSKLPHAGDSGRYIVPEKGDFLGKRVEWRTFFFAWMCLTASK